MAAMMKNMRENTPKEFGGKKVLAVRDYKTSIRTDAVTGATEKIDLPTSDVIYLELEDNNNFVIRPSGTEPKIKLYCLLCGKTREDAESIAEKFKTDISKTIK